MNTLLNKVPAIELVSISWPAAHTTHTKIHRFGAKMIKNPIHTNVA